MPGPKLPLTVAQRRALAVLASAPSGVSEAAMMAHGFSAALLTELVTAGLASAASENTRIGRHTRLRITDAGREALARC